MNIWYFGHYDRPGHYLYGPQQVPGERTPQAQPILDERADYYAFAQACQCLQRWSDRPWCSNVERCQPQGVLKLTHRLGCTYLGMWDRTGDHRYNSASVFIIDAVLDLAAAEAAVASAWQERWARILKAGVVR